MYSCAPSKPAALPVMTMPASTTRRKVILPKRALQDLDKNLLDVETNCESWSVYSRVALLYSIESVVTFILYKGGV